MQKDFNNYNPRINYKELISYNNDEHVSDKNLYVSKHVKGMKENIPEHYFDNKNMANTEESVEDSFNTNTKKYNNSGEEEEDTEEYSDENVTVEHFNNINSYNDILDINNEQWS